MHVPERHVSELRRPRWSSVKDPSKPVNGARNSVDRPLGFKENSAKGNRFVSLWIPMKRHWFLFRPLKLLQSLERTWLCECAEDEA